MHNIVIIFYHQYFAGKGKERLEDGKKRLCVCPSSLVAITLNLPHSSFISYQKLQAPFLSKYRVGYSMSQKRKKLEGNSNLSLFTCLFLFYFLGFVFFLCLSVFFLFSFSFLFFCTSFLPFFNFFLSYFFFSCFSITFYSSNFFYSLWFPLMCQSFFLVFIKSFSLFLIWMIFFHLTHLSLKKKTISSYSNPSPPIMPFLYPHILFPPFWIYHFSFFLPISFFFF